MTEIYQGVLKKQLLKRLVGAQTLSMNILAMAGITCLVNLLQNTFYTPKPWILLIFAAFMSLFYLNRVRIKRIKWELEQIG